MLWRAVHSFRCARAIEANTSGSSKASGGGSGSVGLHTLDFVRASNVSFVGDRGELFGANRRGAKNGGIEHVQEGALNGGGQRAAVSFYTSRVTGSPHAFLLVIAPSHPSFRCCGALLLAGRSDDDSDRSDEGEEDEGEARRTMVENPRTHS